MFRLKVKSFLLRNRMAPDIEKVYLGSVCENTTRRGEKSNSVRIIRLVDVRFFFYFFFIGTLLDVFFRFVVLKKVNFKFRI